MFGVAAVVALVNVVATFGIGLWLGSAIGGWDVQRGRFCSAHQPAVLLVVIAGALMVIEPFWVAAYVTLVRKGEAAESGDDLRRGSRSCAAHEASVVALAFFAFAASAAAMSLDEYIAALQNIETLAHAQRYVDAHAAAVSLSGKTVRSPAGEFQVDDTIVHAFDRPNRVDPKLATRLATTIAELRAVRSEVPRSNPDLKLGQA